jgi:hypothetical protein
MFTVVYLANRCWETLWKTSTCKSEKDTIKMDFTELVVRLLNRIESFLLAGFGTSVLQPTGCVTRGSLVAYLGSLL